MQLHPIHHVNGRQMGHCNSRHCYLTDEGTTDFVVKMTPGDIPVGGQLASVPALTMPHFFPQDNSSIMIYSVVSHSLKLLSYLLLVLGISISHRLTTT